MKFLQQHALFVAGAVIGGYSWHAASGGASTPTLDVEALLPELSASDLRSRDEIEAMADVDDPFKMARILAELAAEREAALEENGAGIEMVEPGEASEPVVEPEFEPPQPEEPAETPSLVQLPIAPIRRPILRLNSTLDSAVDDRSMARLNGNNVEVGAFVPGLDPDDPPQLLEVTGTSATVRYRDVVYTVDLIHLPAVVLGGEPGEVPPPTPEGEEPADFVEVEPDPLVDEGLLEATAEDESAAVEAGAEEGA